MKIVIAALLIVGSQAYAFSSKDRVAKTVLSPTTIEALQAPPAPAFSDFDQAEAAPLAEPAVISGFGLITKAAAPAVKEAPIFSGFGHATAASVAEAPAPVFSGFSHATEAAAAAPSGFGGVTQVVEDDVVSDFSLDPDLQEAKQYLHAARDKVLSLRKEIGHKEKLQKALVQKLRTEFKSQGDGYESRLEYLADQFQEFKFAAHKDKMALKEQLKIRETEILQAASLKEEELKLEITTLEEQLEAARQEVTMAQTLAKQMADHQVELKSNFTELRQMYMEDHIEWEDRLEMEQMARQKDRVLADFGVTQAKEEAGLKIRKARNEGKSIAEAVRADLTKRLWQKENVLQKTAIDLERTTHIKNDLEGRVGELELERVGLRALSKQTAKVAQKKATNTLQKVINFVRIQKLLNFVRRNKME